jgi:adenylosuccinate synthase
LKGISKMITVVVGLQRGDCGKGRIADVFANGCEMVIRCQGGNNAGHTIKIGEELYKLHHIPAGVLRNNVKCLLSAGMVINPVVFMEEINGLQQRGVDTSNVWVDGSAHINFPLYSNLDQQEENDRGVAIGTTSRGIGPAYSAKYARHGMQYWDAINLSEENFWIKLFKLYSQHLVRLSDSEIHKQIDDVRVSLDAMKNRIIDGRQMVRDAIVRDDDILVEGAQGAFLDIDYGPYPFVTSSCTTATGACLGTGIGIREIDRIIGVAKAYSTYVGNGVYLAEANEEDAHILRETAGEYGTTTGRPRRCGWFDIPMLRTAMDLNSTNDIVLTKLDILSVLPEIKIVIHYLHPDGYLIDDMPSNPAVLAACKPVYETLPGWQEDITNAKSLADLPKNAQNYIKFIEEAVDFPIAYVSVGPERDQMFFTG